MRVALTVATLVRAIVIAVSLLAGERPLSPDRDVMETDPAIDGGSGSRRGFHPMNRARLSTTGPTILKGSAKVTTHRNALTATRRRRRRRRRNGNRDRSIGGLVVGRIIPLSKRTGNSSSRDPGDIQVVGTAQTFTLGARGHLPSGCQGHSHPRLPMSDPSLCL